MFVRRVIPAVLLALVLVTLVATPLLRGQEEDPGAEALEKAVETGKELFHSEDFGTAGRACAKCHENPRKPEMNLKTRVRNYPKWDRREGKVITLGQKISQMHQKMLRGEALPLGSEKHVAVEAYLMSLSRQAD